MRAFILATAALAACSAGAARFDDRIPVTADELRSLLHGSFLEREEYTPGGIDLPLGWREYFCADGNWSQTGGRIVAQGRFTVEGSVVCVESANAQRRCRTFTRDRSGQLYAQVVADDPPPPIRVRILNEFNEPWTHCNTSTN